jgi:hypothetical protein
VTASEKPREVKSIDDLPLAPPETHVTPPQQRLEDALRAAANRTHTPPRPEHRAGSDTLRPVIEAPSTTTAPESTASSPSTKKPDHDSLWGRD